MVASSLALLAVPAVLAASPAAPPAAPAGEELETVTVYGRVPQPVGRVAASVTAIDATAIAGKLAADVAELVRYEPGVSVRNDPFRFGLDTFTVRGVGGNRVAVEIDGIAAADGFAVGSFSDSGRAFVDLALLERVEILRGPASSLYGSDALGGVVSMEMLRPADLLGPGPATSALRGEAGASGDDDGWHAALTGAARTGSAAFLLGYVRREGHELETAADVEPNPRDYASDSLLARLELDAGAGGPLTLTAEGGRVEQQTDVRAFLGLPGRFVNTVALRGEDSMRRQRFSVEQGLGATRAFDRAEWRAYLQGTDTRQRTFEQRKAVPPRTPPVQIDREFRYRIDTAGAEFTAVRELATGRTDHSLVYGVELASSRIEERRDGLQTNLLTGATTATILGESFPLRDFPNTGLLEAGVFVQDELQIGESGWSLIPALRADWYRLDARADALYRADNPSTEPVDVGQHSLSPKLGLTCRLGGPATAYFQYAHGFRSPPLEDVNIGLELPLFNVRAIPNPDLEPERSDGYELGLRWRGEGLALDASVFYNDYADFIESKVNLGPEPATGVILFQSQNVAEARIYGAELQVTLGGAALAAPLRDWTLRLAAAWAAGRDEVHDQPLNSVDPPSAVLALRYAPASARWGAELVTTAVAAKDDLDETRADLYATDGHVTLDLLARLELGRGLRLNLGVFNLTGAEYIQWADVRGRPEGDPLTPYYTRPGRSLSVALHGEF